MGSSVGLGYSAWILGFDPLYSACLIDLAWLLGVGLIDTARLEYSTGQEAVIILLIHSMKRGDPATPCCQ